MSEVKRPLGSFRPWAVVIALALVGCGNLVDPPARLGMVKDPATGLQFGSVVERNIVTDPSFHGNRKIKVRTRNTSGDTAFDLDGFTTRINDAYRTTGFVPTAADDFGVLVDVNVVYSGQIQANMAAEYAFLGGAGGGIAGYRSSTTAGTAIGVLSGATLGSILGSFVTDDTYIIVARVSVGTVKDTRRVEDKTVTFSRSPRSGETREEEEERYRESISRRGLQDMVSTQLAVYAGGRNVPQARIADEVRQRVVRIVGDII